MKHSGAPLDNQIRSVVCCFRKAVFLDFQVFGHMVISVPSTQLLVEFSCLVEGNKLTFLLRKTLQTLYCGWSRGTAESKRFEKLELAKSQPPLCSTQGSR